MPIEVFIDNYTDVELDKYGGKPLETSPKMKRFMAAWVGGLNPRQISPEKLREGFVKAMQGHRFASAYGIRDPKLGQRKTGGFRHTTQKGNTDYRRRYIVFRDNIKSIL